MINYLRASKGADGRVVGIVHSFLVLLARLKLAAATC